MKKKMDPILKEAFNTPNEAEADYATSKWMGAVFYYLLNAGKKPFEHFYQKQFHTRNLWTGYVFKLVVMALALFAFYKLGSWLYLT